MKKNCIVLIILVALLALAACKQSMAPDGGQDKGNTGGGGTTVEPPSFDFSGISKYVATTNGNSEQVKGSFKSGGLYYYYIYLGQLKNIPLFYGMKFKHLHALGNPTYQYTKATTNTISTTVTESSSQTVSVSEKHTTSSSSETTLKAEASVKYKDLFVTAEAKASAEQKWKTYTEDTSGFQRDTSFTNTVMYGSSKAESTQEAYSISLTEKQREGYYRFTLFSVSDVYAWVIKDPAQPDALYLEFKEYILPLEEFTWEMDYTDFNHPVFDKTDDTKFKLDLSVLDNLPPPALDLDYVEEISLDRPTLTIVKNATFQLFAIIKPDYATIKGVTWTSSNTAVAAVSNTGLVTGYNEGTATITAKPVDPAYKGAPATCIVTVKIDPVAVTDVNLNKTSVTIVKGKTDNLIPIFIPSNATNPNVTWRTNPASSPVATVSNTGTVTALDVGTVDVIVMTEDGGYEKTCKVTVKPIPVDGVNLYIPEKLILDTPDGIGDLGNPTSVTLNWEVTPNDAGNQNVTWTSSNTAVATVSNGVVTPKAAGTTTIKVTTVDGGFNKSVTFTVRGAWNVNSNAAWVNALSSIKENGNGTANDNKTYAINVGNNFSVAGSTANTFGSVNNVTVTLLGSGTLSLSSQGSLLTVGNYQTVDINSPYLTLQGLNKEGNRNNTTLVRVNGGGSLTLKSGNITGNGNYWQKENYEKSNTYTRTNGAGVFVDATGSFTMTGGTISGHRVYTENYGSTNNYSQTKSFGGGVYVADKGSFIMTGGTITGNSTGAYIYGSSSGEPASYGGGVFIENSGTFSKTGDSVIYGSNEGDVLRNICQAYTNKDGKCYIRGHAVYWENSSQAYQRDNTLGKNQNLSTSDIYSGNWIKAKDL